MSFTTTASQEERRPPWLAWVTVAAAAALVAALVISPFLRPFAEWSWISAFWALLDLYLLWPIASITLQEAFGGDEIPGAAPDRAPSAEAESTTHTYLLGAYERPPLPEDIVA